MTPDQPLLTLAQAAQLIPGADTGTLKRMIRRGTLSAYRPGKAYLTTAADVQKAVQACRVTPKARASGSVQLGQTAPLPVGSSETDHANAELDSALAQAAKKKTRP